MRPVVRLLSRDERGVGEALVVAEVEVGFGAVVGDEDLAVLEGRHGPGIDVEVGVELHQIDREAARFSRQPMDAAASPLPSGHNSAGHKDVLC